MPSMGSLRGNINAILNPLVGSGEIKGFSTNLYEKPAPEQSVVTVLVESQRDAEVVSRRVSQALEPLGQHITVRVEVRSQRGRQDPEGRM